MFDGVIIDSTDPNIGISAGLFTIEFQNNVQRLMTKDAMLCQQCDTNYKAIEAIMPVFKKTKLEFMEVKKLHTVE